MVAGLFFGSDESFCDFRYGEMAAAGAVVEKGFEHDGLRLDRERTALDDCRMGIILEAMISVKELPQDARGRWQYKAG